MNAESICVGVVAAVLWTLAGPAAAQVPDNRDPRLDPEDLVPPAYNETLEERDSQRLDAARQAGETFIPLIQGPGTAPGAGCRRPGGTGTRALRAHAAATRLRGLPPGCRAAAGRSRPRGTRRR